MKQAPTDNRQRILETGEAIIAGKGFSAVGLAEILSAAGVPKGSFYYYFESKEQFGEALLEAYFEDYLARLDGLLGAVGQPVPDRLMAYWQGWLSLQCQQTEARQCLVVKLSAEVSDLSEAMRGVLLRGTDQVLSRLAACIAEGVGDGSLPPGLEPQDTARALYQLWLGSSLLAKVHRDGAPLAVALERTRAWLGLAGA